MVYLISLEPILSFCPHHHGLISIRSLPNLDWKPCQHPNPFPGPLPRQADGFLLFFIQNPYIHPSYVSPILLHLPFLCPDNFCLTFKVSSVIVYFGEFPIWFKLRAPSI